jgi:alanine racemase
MYDSSIIEISRSALQANLNFLKKHTGPHARYCSVVKGNAYGHGLAEFVNLAVTCGVDYFAVYSADEAYQIVQHVNPVPDIYIMGNVEGEAIEWAILNGIEISISDIKRLENALDYARKNGKKALVHIEIETGMNRTGFEANELNAAAELINKNSKHIEIMQTWVSTLFINMQHARQP